MGTKLPLDWLLKKNPLWWPIAINPKKKYFDLISAFYHFLYIFLKIKIFRFFVRFGRIFFSFFKNQIRVLIYLIFLIFKIFGIFFI